jgi:hypothetical protein
MHVLAKCFAYNKLLNQSRYIIAQFGKRGNDGLGRFSKLPKNTQLVSHRAGFWFLLGDSAIYLLLPGWPSLVDRSQN